MPALVSMQTVGIHAAAAAPVVLAHHVCFEACWWLQRHLHTVLQYADGEGRAGHAGQPQSEVLVHLQAAKTAREKSTLFDSLGGFT
jgi:hypothetical protein